MSGVALVGASEEMPWTYWLIRNLAEHGYSGPVWPVNPRREQVHGLTAYPSLADLPGVPSAAVCLLRPDLAETAIDQLVELGTRVVVLISNGFRETGDEAAAERESRIARRCRDADVRLIGPNCVGFADFGSGLALVAEPLPAGLRPGPVTVASQSGALLSGAVGAVAGSGHGLRRAYSIGNGAAFGVTDAVEEFCSDDASVLVLVLEAVAEPDRFAAAVATAKAAGKHVIALRLGRSDRAATVAKSHTGAVVGPDHLWQAWLSRLGVVEADTIEELPVLVTLLMNKTRQADGGVFILTGSGGAAGYAADLASRTGVALAELSAATVDGLREVMPPGVFIGNPLDLTGANAERKKRVNDLIYADPAVAIVVEPYSLPWPDEAPDRHWFRAGLLGLAEASARSGRLTLTASVSAQPLTSWMTDLHAVGDVVAGQGFVAAMGAVAKVYPAASTRRPAPAAEPWAADESVLAEAQSREVLAALGVPLVRGELAADAESSARYAATLTGPVAIKAAVEGLAHKGRLGGVRLDLTTPEAVAQACEEMAASLAARGVSAPVRFLVQQMVRGPELLLGFTRDATAGPAVTIGVGGWAVELVSPLLTISLSGPRSQWDAAALRTLIDSCGLAQAIGDRAAGELAELTAQLASHFVTGPLADYATLECNPVTLTANGPVVVDALLIA
jgi:acetate---CoA ligase (ADP-forming)